MAKIIGCGGILLLGILFIIIGIQFHRRKWLCLMAGNTFGDLPKEIAEKAAGTCSVAMFIGAGVCLFIGAGLWFNFDSWIMLTVIGVVTFISLIYLVIALKHWVKTGY